MQSVKVYVPKDLDVEKIKEALGIEEVEEVEIVESDVEEIIVEGPFGKVKNVNLAGALLKRLRH